MTRPGSKRRTRAAPGRFLVIEGIDGAGTTTQARLLGERLREAGRRVHVTSEPSGGPIGTLIRQVLSGRLRGRAPDGPFDPEALALLFAADRLDHARSEILPALAAGIDVISDRYTLSSLAYQALTTGDPRWVGAMNGRAPAPDVTIMLRVVPEVAFARRSSASHAREIYEKAQFQRRVAAAYEAAVKVLRRSGQRVEILDGGASPGEVAAEIDAIVGRIRAARP
jgi:dTMP kinase